MSDYNFIFEDGTLYFIKPDGTRLTVAAESEPEAVLEESAEETREEAAEAAEEAEEEVR